MWFLFGEGKLAFHPRIEVEQTAKHTNGAAKGSRVASMLGVTWWKIEQSSLEKVCKGEDRLKTSPSRRHHPREIKRKTVVYTTQSLTTKIIEVAIEDIKPCLQSIMDKVTFTNRGKMFGTGEVQFA